MPVTKLKQRLCCMMRPLGECRYCHKVVCTNHGKGIYEIYVLKGQTPEMLAVQCFSTKCNDATVKVRIDVERRRQQRVALRVAAGLAPMPVNHKGKALLERISSQKDHQSISKISSRKRRKH